MVDDELDELTDEELEGPAPLRRAYDKAKSRLKTQQEEAEQRVREAEARGEAKAERKFQAVQHLGEHGYTEPKFAEIWVNQLPEDQAPDKEKALEFLTGLGLEPKVGPPKVDAKPDGTDGTPPPKVLTPEEQAAAASFHDGTTPTPPGELSNKDIKALLQSDPEGAMTAIRAKMRGITAPAE